MQDLRDNEKKTIKNDRNSAILNFISAKFFMGYPCVSPYILSYLHVPAILWFLSCLRIAKLLKFKMAARPLFRNCLFLKANQVIG